MVGDYVLCAGPATDSVPRLHSNLSYLCMRLPPGQVVASCGGRGELFSLTCILAKSRRVSYIR